MLIISGTQWYDALITVARREGRPIDDDDVVKAAINEIKALSRALGSPQITANVNARPAGTPDEDFWKEPYSADKRWVIE